MMGLYDKTSAGRKDTPEWRKDPRGGWVWELLCASALSRDETGVVPR